jgi:hypothetical protein
MLSSTHGSFFTQQGEKEGAEIPKQKSQTLKMKQIYKVENM